MATAASAGKRRGWPNSSGSRSGFSHGLRSGRASGPTLSREPAIPRDAFRTGSSCPSQEVEFFRGVDYLVLAMPLTPQTRGIVGAAELALLRPSAAILNPARGPLIEEEPLLTALREHRIRAAALDTHYHYPLPPEHALWGMENVILTPHISGSSQNPHFHGTDLEYFRAEHRSLSARRTAYERGGSRRAGHGLGTEAGREFHPARDGGRSTQAGLILTPSARSTGRRFRPAPFVWPCR